MTYWKATIRMPIAVSVIAHGDDRKEAAKRAVEFAKDEVMKSLRVTVAEYDGIVLHNAEESPNPKVIIDPAVTHEMTAREFFEITKRRAQEEKRRVEIIFEPVDQTLGDFDGWIAAAEQWAKEHPVTDTNVGSKRKTYAEDFLREVSEGKAHGTVSARRGDDGFAL